jgi:hypothetical protein
MGVVFKAWKDWARLRARMKSNLALVSLRRNTFKEQGVLAIWRRYYHYRLIITTAGIINIRNNSPKALMACYAFMNDTTQFVFVSCFRDWVSFIKV